MAPALRNVRLPDESVLREAKQSGVLILFYPHENSPHIVFMLRPSYSGPHSGQISFPGGRQEKEDDDLRMTALREAQEEVGVNPSQVNILGNISPLYIPPSDFYVEPVVGYTLERPDFQADPVEVEKIIELPIEYLLDKNNRQTREIELRSTGRKITTPCYVVGDHIIWGATAMMLSELLTIVPQSRF